VLDMTLDEMDGALHPTFGANSKLQWSQSVTNGIWF